MRKRLLFALGALLALPVMAQEEDVTHYIQNAGFDEDLTFQIDGTMKEAISTTTSLSDRSWAYIAADSTVYARPKTTSGQSRPDGRKLEAVNGFKGRVKGWTMESNSDFPKCEWTYFGSVPYDLAKQSVPIADDGSTYLEVPQRPTDFDGGVGFVYLRAGWTNSALYKQVVKLPCAVYRLEYWTININPNTTAVAADLTQIQCRKEVFKDEEGTGLNAQEWTKHEFEFTPTAEFTMQFGYQAANAGSGGQPIVALDGIKLYKIGEADPMELLQADINDLEEECSQLSGQAALLGFSGLASQIDDWIIEGGIDDLRLISDATELEAAIKDAKAIIAKYTQALNTIESITAIMTKMDNLLQNTNYPGKDDLQAAYTTLVNIKEGTLDGADYATLMLTAVETAKEAIMAYYMSQKSTASVENPADFTIFIQHPWFIDEDAEPFFEDGMWVFPKRYDAETGDDRYVQGSASSPDLNSGGWAITGTYTAGSEQRLNWQRERSCWNAWGGSITGTIAVGQTIENLPNGYYTISADLLCQPEYVSDQHVYAQSVTEKIISADNLSAHEIDYDNSVWATVSMTAEEKVLVVDGTLTIGAEGTGNGTNQTGWFLGTNFKLNFLGEASDEVIAAALKKSFDACVAEAKELADVMMFAADKKALNDSIAKYEVAADKDAYITSIKAIQAAVAEAQKSEAKYYDYLPTPETLEENPDLISSKTLLWVKALLDGESVIDHNPFSEQSKPIAQFALDYVNGYIVCDTATYKEFDAQVDLLKNYVNTYIPVFDEAFNIADFANENGKNALNSLLNTQKAALVSEMKDKATVDAYVNELKDMMVQVEKQNIYDNPDATDYTAFIKNPNLEAETGWTFDKGNGNSNTNGGQWMDGSSTRYIDSYNSNGLVGFKATQLIKDLPNGTYTVGIYTRTPAEGAYVLYALESDTTFVEIPINLAFDASGDPVLDDNGEQIIASDKYGPIWEAALAAVNSGEYTNEEQAIANANDGIGRGWKHQEMKGIEVKNHELLIGTMAGTEASKSEKVFAGSWYSVGGWTLTLTAKGDNTGWEGPIGSGINSIVVSSDSMADGIYTLSGVKTSRLQQGVNIVVVNGKVRKVMVK